MALTCSYLRNEEIFPLIEVPLVLPLKHENGGVDMYPNCPSPIPLKRVCC